MTTPFVHKYTWREHWVFPYESLWSLLNKFGLLNWISGMEIKNLFRAGEDEERFTENDGIGKWNFHGGKGFNFLKISQVLNLSDRHLKEAVTTTLILKREIPLLTETKKLRYCPVCISSGYHSVVHQFRNVKVCPVHDIDLVDKCLRCKRDIPYDLHDCKHFYSCSFCTARLLTSEWDDLYESERYKEILDRKEKLDAAFEWFCSIKKNVIYPKMDRKYFEKTDKIVDCWGDLAHKRLPDFLKISQKNKVHKSAVLAIEAEFPRKVLRLKTAASLNNDTYFNQREFRYIFKSIRRHIMKRFKTYKIKCHNPPWSIEPTCTLHKAFKAWRLYWEKETKGREVLWIYSILKADLGKASLNKKVAERVFALECYWTFEDCITHTNTLDYEYLWGNRDYKRYPYWTIEKEDAQIIFHSWAEKGVLSNLVKGQCPACMCNHSVEANVA